MEDQEFRAEVITRTEEKVKAELGEESTGHDWWHAVRVRDTAVRIARREGADEFVVGLAALLHDVEDYKFSGDVDAGPRFAAAWLVSLGVDRGTAGAVAEIIGGLSFKGARVAEPVLSLEGRCIQDADRLDAIGAIGVSRVFAFGGFRGRPIHDPRVPAVLHTSADAYRSAVGTSINHFHEKLLLLKDRMNTAHGRELAEERHRFMVAFLDRFTAEWDGRA